MIQFKPAIKSHLWQMKCITTHEDVNALREYLAEMRTRTSFYIGDNVTYSPQDFVFVEDEDTLFGWKNYSKIMLNGFVVGYCGEGV